MRQILGIASILTLASGAYSQIFTYQWSFANDPVVTPLMSPWTTYDGTGFLTVNAGVVTSISGSLWGKPIATTPIPPGTIDPTQNNAWPLPPGKLLAFYLEVGGGPDKTFYGSTLGGSSFLFEAADGTGMAFGSLSFTQVPEPSTYAVLMAAGLLGMAAWRRTRR